MRFSLSPPLPQTTTTTSISSSLPVDQLPSTSFGTDDDASSAADISSDFNQWLHAMKMVARLPGGMPPEFRKKVILLVRK